MARYTGPRAKISRRLGTNIWGTKGETIALDRRPYPPGEHGRDRRRGNQSDYLLQLTEKQKARFTYGLTEAQLNTPPSGTHGDAFCYETASIAELTQWCREQLQPTAPASESRLVMANDLHLAMHTLSAIARRRAELGLGSQAGSGTVSSIHTSGGGVPKSSMPSCHPALPGARKSVVATGIAE